MSKPCQDSYSINFTSFPLMLAYHEKMRQESRWERTEVNHLTVAPLDKNSPLFGDRTSFAPAVSEDAIRDTADNLGLAIKLGDHYYPLRDTAYKSLLDRAKINGTALPKLSREKLSEVLNSCLALHNKSGALLLIRDEKVAAAHSGDSRDYSILEIDQLLEGLRDKMDARFPDNRFLGGYSDHAITSASWSLPMQKEDLLGAYEKMLESMGFTVNFKKTCDILSQYIFMRANKVGNILDQSSLEKFTSRMAVEHRRQSKIPDFIESLDQLFAQYGDSIARLTNLLTVQLEHPVNAMTAICKKLSLPKKAALESIAMFEAAIGNGPATAHDVFMSMQEIPFIMKTSGVPESKLLTVQETMARALTLRWSDYDYAKQVSY